jgi:hypothetical protein
MTSAALDSLLSEEGSGRENLILRFIADSV